MPAAARILALQRSAGNQAAARMLARSPMKLPGPVGEVTVGVEPLDFTTHNEAKAVRELTLGTTGATGFEGYETEEEAAVAASASEQVGVVVADKESRFHAFETDLEPDWGPVQAYATGYRLAGARVVRWTHLNTPGDASAYAEQLRYAGSVASSPDADVRALAIPFFMNVLVAAVGFKRSELHDSSLSLPVAGKLNFDVHLTDSNAHAGVAGAIPSDRETPLGEPKLTVGPKAFQDLASLRGTLLHEYTHMRHAVQTIEAVERWRATTTEGTFENWLKRQQKTGKIDAIEFAVINEQVTSKTSNTESLSYLVSFTATYHLRDLASIPDDDAGETFLFGKLDELAVEWLKADHAVEDQVIEQLNAYRDTTLGEEHRRRLVAFTTKRHGQYLEEAPLRLFWGPLR